MNGHFFYSCPIASFANTVLAQKEKIARPTPEALAVDVFSTVKQYGFPINVLSDYSQEMNRYAFLMIE